MMKMKSAFVISMVISLALNALLITLYWRQLVDSESGRVVSYYRSMPQTSPDEAYVLLLGDSRISRWNPLPSFKDVEVLNLGCGGAISSDLLVQVIQTECPQNIKMAVIGIGINDLKIIGSHPQQKDFIISRCQSNIKQAIEILRQKDIPVTVLPILPPGEVGWLRNFVWSDEIDKAILEVNEFLSYLQTEGTILMDCSEIIKADGRLRQQYAQDTLHLNSLGYEALNRILLSSINQSQHERVF